MKIKSSQQSGPVGQNGKARPYAASGEQQAKSVPPASLQLHPNQPRGKRSRKRIVEKTEKRSSKNSQFVVVDGQHRVECFRRFQLGLNETPEKWIPLPPALLKKLATCKTSEVAKS
jgi:hypothetical protein